MIPKDRQSRRGSGGQQGTRNKVVSTLLIQVLFFCATVDSDTPRHAGISAVASKEGWTSRPRAVASYTARIGKDTGITSSKSVESVHAWGHTMWSSERNTRSYARFVRRDGIMHKIALDARTLLALHDFVRVYALCENKSDLAVLNHHYRWLVIKICRCHRVAMQHIFNYIILNLQYISQFSQNLNSFRLTHDTQICIAKWLLSQLVNSI